MIKKTCGSLVLACMLFGSVTTVNAVELNDSEIEQMTDVVVEMMPIIAVAQQAAAKDPTWPMGEKVGSVTSEQLVCVRAELSSDGLRRMKRAEVMEYAKNHADSFMVDLELARKVSPLIRQLGMAGMKAHTEGAEMDYASAVKSATPSQFVAMMSFTRDPEHAALRDLTGFGDALGLDGSAREKRETGEMVGRLYVIKLFVHALETCKVPTAELFFGSSSNR